MSGTKTGEAILFGLQKGPVVGMKLNLENSSHSRSVKQQQSHSCQLTSLQLPERRGLRHRALGRGTLVPAVSPRSLREARKAGLLCFFKNQRPTSAAVFPDTGDAASSQSALNQSSFRKLLVTLTLL